MNSLLDLGADGIMTDQTDLLRKVMIDRGQWHPRPGADEF
jgi:glycerophosphoryl diester phosphodiesterase